MISNWLPWIPIALTALMMFFARVSHIAVLNYNLFLASLIVWAAALIAFYRILALKAGTGGKRSHLRRLYWKN